MNGRDGGRYEDEDYGLMVVVMKMVMGIKFHLR